SLHMPRRPPPPPHFPYTTLFRSREHARGVAAEDLRDRLARDALVEHRLGQHRDPAGVEPDRDGAVVVGSERHVLVADQQGRIAEDRKSTRLNSSHEWISYAVFCL